MKLKNWIYYPPVYPNTVPEAKSQIADNEVFLLWAHLVFRYNNIRLTQMYSEMTSDVDFSVLLKAGKGILENQADEVEKKLLHFGIVLPKPYSTIPLTFTKK